LSYNGKSFDWPLLRTRFILNRVAAPRVPPHFDLLHCVRRVFKPRIGDARLADVEQQVLGFYREGDMDGAEIPGVYLRFLRGADPATLEPILEHNANDLIALAALLGKVTRHFESVQSADDPIDHLAFAKVAARAQNTERALSFARAAAEGAGSDNVTVDALVLTAKLSKRYGDPQTAVEALLKALEAAPDPQAASYIHLELAKLYERKVRDPERAYQHALHAAEAEEQEAHLRRLARLQKHLGKASS
jgi:tetratricopeptide (TPR) repeat protein